MVSVLAWDICVSFAAQALPFPTHLFDLLWVAVGADLGVFDVCFMLTGLMRSAAEASLVFAVVTVKY